MNMEQETFFGPLVFELLFLIARHVYELNIMQNPKYKIDKAEQIDMGIGEVPRSPTASSHPLSNFGVLLGTIGAENHRYI